MNHDDAFQLSPQQRVRWLAGLPPATLNLELDGPLNLEPLRERLAQLLACHESLRLRLRPEPGLQVPLQWVDNTRPLAERIHVLHAPASEPLAAADGLITLTVESLAANRHRLQLQFPVLAADRGTLLRIAEALTTNAAPGLDDDAMSYTQYSTWLYDLQNDEDADYGRRFWASQTPFDSAASELLYREQRTHEAPALISTRSQTDTAFATALDRFCQHHGASPEEVLLTAWCVLLQRLGTDDAAGLNMNWVHDCRDDYEELAACWGLFAKALPLPWQAALESSFSQALERLRGACDQAREWQEYCAVVGHLQPQTLRYGFEWGGRLPTRHNGLSVTALQAIPQAIELLLIAEAGPSGYGLTLAHDAACYSHHAATILLEQYQSLLLDALAHPDKALCALSLQAPGFTARLAMQQPAAETADVPFTSLTTLFSRQVIASAGQPALRDATVQLTYQELDARSNRLAHYLRSQGVGREDRVALYLERSAEMVVAMLAVLKSGAAFLPLDTQQPAQRIQTILQAAEPALLLSSGSVAPALPGLRSLDLSQAGTWQNSSDNALDSAIQPADAAYVLFTSGSTGTPKGVVIEHRQLASYVGSILKRLPLAAGDTSAVVTSLAADLGYTLLFPALLSGGELHVVDKDTAMDAQAWADYQSRHGIDHLKIVPSLLDAWLSHADSAALPRKSLVLGGETCSRRLLESIRRQAPALAVCNHYGPTETTIGVLMHALDAGVDYRRLPLSERLDQMRVYLLDDQGQTVAPGQSAELYIAGPQLARGYLDDQQTRERFIEHPQLPGERLYRTGDLARYRPDGSLEITGRADRQVKIRGYRVELDEVEAQLAKLPGVAQAAVECVPRGNLEQQLFAFVTPTAGQAVSIAQLQGQAQDRLPDYMLPTLRIVESLPLMVNGKLDRKTLRQWADKVLDAVGGTLPRTPLEGLLAQIWADVLGLERVGIEDDFFALGGHSLAAVKLASRLQKALATPVSVNAVFSAPSVQAFAVLVQEQMQLSPLVRLSPATSTAAPGPNLFCFHPSTGHVQDYRTLVEPLADWTIWGLQAVYLAEGDQTSDAHSIDSLATRYVAELRQQQAEGPYHLLGWSLGGLLAIAVAARLEQAGQAVAFLGVVDSQYQRLSDAESVGALLHAAEQALTPESLAYWRQLPAETLEPLIYRLQTLPARKRLPDLVQWARQQGLELVGDSWEHLAIRLGHHEQTQQLLASFQPPVLRCPVHAWWASDTLAVSDFGDPGWEQLSPAPLYREVVEATHLTILQQPYWQQQLSTCLDDLHPATVPAYTSRLRVGDTTDETA